MFDFDELAKLRFGMTRVSQFGVSQALMRSNGASGSRYVKGGAKLDQCGGVKVDQLSR